MYTLTFPLVPPLYGTQSSVSGHAGPPFVTHSFPFVVCAEWIRMLSVLQAFGKVQRCPARRLPALLHPRRAKHGLKGTKVGAWIKLRRGESTRLEFLSRFLSKAHCTFMSSGCVVVSLYIVILAVANHCAQCPTLYFLIISMFLFRAHHLLQPMLMFSIWCGYTCC